MLKSATGSVLVETRAYSDAIAASAAIRDLRSKDATEATYTAIQGLGDTAYSVNDRLVMAADNVGFLITFGVRDADDPDSAEVIRLSVAAAALGRFRELQPGGRDITDDELESFFKR